MTALNTTELFALEIANADRTSAIAALFERRQTAAFVNAHAANLAHTDPAFRWALERADVLLADGSGMSLAAKLKGQRLQANLNGTDLFVPLCQEAARRGKSVFLLGAKPGVADRAAETIARIVPGLRVAGTHHGYFDKGESEAVIDLVNGSGADIVLVAFGVPLQDVWVARHRHKLTASLVMGVGALFDFFSGDVARAPLIMRKAGIEWVWRLALEPRRLAARYLIGNFTFMMRAVRDRSASAAPIRVGGRRLVDLLLSSAALAALSPLCAATALAIKLDSRGPVLFRQTRIGQNGTPFTVYKFRTMYRDAQARRAMLLASSDRNGVCFKKKDDPRITRVGKLLRRFSIDELPQLFNVLKGEMALVGPRPGLAEEVAQYPESAMARLSVRPGLTGLWQVAGRASVGFTKMIDMDRAYARSRALTLDLALIALTARAVLSGRGAF